jgi:integrase
MISPKTYNERLALLKRFNKWMFKQDFWTSFKLEDVNKKKEKKSVRPERVPFTKTEIQQILEAIKADSFQTNRRYSHSHYYPFLYFLVSTGVRNAEAIGLRVGSVDLQNNLIHIKEALARSIKGTNSSERIRKETKTGIERYIPLMEDLKTILLPLLQDKKVDDLVFQSHTGLSIDDKKFQKYIFKPVQVKLGITPRVLYACRHYFGSRCIETGMSPVQTAFLMGNSPEVCLRNYTHQMNIPSILPSL